MTADWKRAREVLTDDAAELERWCGEPIAMVVLPVGAGLSDSFGRKPILVFGGLMTFKSLCANLIDGVGDPRGPGCLHPL